MFIILKTAFASIKKRVLQSILVGIVLILVSAFLFTGLCISTQHSSFEQMYDRANASHSFLLLPKLDNYVEETVDWFDNKQEIESMVTYESSMINCEYEQNGETQTEVIFWTEYNETTELDILYVDNEHISAAPECNQMLVNYNFAKGRDLEVGDQIRVKYNEEYHDFEISGLVVDPQFDNDFVTPNRCFIVSDYFKNHNIKNDLIILGLKYHDENMNEVKLIEDFNKHLDSPIVPIVIYYDAIKSSYKAISSIIANILMAVSILIFVIIVFVIRSIIQNIIFKQYREIGVKKSIGYTSKQIRLSLITMYSIIGFVSSIIGAILGIPIVKLINNQLNYDLQIQSRVALNIYMPITVIMIVLFIIFFVFTKTRKIDLVKPVQAIKFGMPESNYKTSHYRITKKTKAPLVLRLAIKSIINNKWKTISRIALTTLLLFSSLLIYSIANTVSDLPYFAGNVFGMRVGDFAVTTNSGENAIDGMEKIRSLKNVDEVVMIEFESAQAFNVTMSPEGDRISIGAIVVCGDVSDDFVFIDSGRQPSDETEVCISSIVADETGKSAGDYITIYSSDDVNEYLISGIYNSIMQSGHSYLMIKNHIPPTLKQSDVIYWGYSNENYVIIDEIDEKVKDILGDDATVTRYDSNMENIISATSSLPDVLNIMLFVFMLVCGVIILNFTLMDISNRTKTYGIMKAMGFSRWHIGNILILKTLIITFAGGMLGFAINLITADGLLEGLLRLTPYASMKLPIIFDNAGSVLLIVLFIVMALVGTIIPMKRIGDISPKQLISE